ncbi:MAG TPA: hypothetical protein VK631_23675 [Solirubrobacteraceae bacterium]|nr:hypothetical protein [Solirubrobacteraceae bacterium]
MATETVDETTPGTGEGQGHEQGWEYDGPEGRKPDGDEPEVDAGALADAAGLTADQATAAAEGKKSLADLAAEAPAREDAPETPDEPEMQLFGTEEKVTGTVKGVRQAQSSVKFKAAPVVVRGQFQPDDIMELRVLARLDKVEFAYTRDRQGAIKAVKRVHFASATSVEQVLDAQRQQVVYERAAAALGVDASQLAKALEDARYSEE